LKVFGLKFIDNSFSYFSPAVASPPDKAGSSGSTPREDVSLQYPPSSGNKNGQLASEFFCN